MDRGSRADKNRAGPHVRQLGQPRRRACDRGCAIWQASRREGNALAAVDDALAGVKLAFIEIQALEPAIDCGAG